MCSTSICSFLELSLLKTDLETDEGEDSEGVTLSHHLNNFSTPFPHPKKNPLPGASVLPIRNI